MKNMSDIKMKEEIGGVIISEEVIASIAVNAAKDVTGVAGFANRPSDLKGLFRKGGAAANAVKVTMTDSDLVLDIYVTLINGTRIPTVAEAIQTTVKDAVQNMTNTLVSKINVHIMGIIFPEEFPAQ